MGFSGIDPVLPHVSELRQIKELDLGGSSVTDAGMENIKPLVRLEVLTLGDTSVGDIGLRNIETLSRLRKLELGGVASSRTLGSRVASRLGRLEGLNIDRTRITDDGLKHLEHLTGIIYLVLRAGRTDGDWHTSKVSRGCGRLYYRTPPLPMKEFPVSKK